MLAAVLLGILEVFGGFWFGQVVGSALLYIVMLGVLLARPSGLLGVKVRL
jgi:branched-chain amino acid transport system permease protein